MALTWTVTLKDGLSSPAENVAQAVAALQRKLQALRSQTPRSGRPTARLVPTIRIVRAHHAAFLASDLEK